MELLHGSELTDADLLAADATVLLGAPHNPSEPIDEVDGENRGPHELNSGDDWDSLVFTEMQNARVRTLLGE